MSNALDMSLDDIIKTQKASRPRNGTNNRGGRGGRNNNNSTGPARNTRQSRDNKPYSAGAQSYRAPPMAPLLTSTLRQSVPDGSKMQVSNLDHRVSADDLKLVFTSRVGPLKKCTINYDQNGKSLGTALVHFQRVGDAAIAFQRFNTVPLDGKPMKIEIVLAPGAPSVVPNVASQPRAQQQQPHQQQRGDQRGGRGARGRGGRGGRGGRSSDNKREPKKTADQLDAEMTDYMQVDA